MSYYDDDDEPTRHRHEEISIPMQTLRTPDERFADLPDFPYAPHYCEVDDDEGGTLRIAWIEAGPATPTPF